MSERDNKFYEILTKRTTRFFKELIQYQKNYHKTGQLYLENSKFFNKKGKNQCEKINEDMYFSNLKDTIIQNRIASLNGIKKIKASSNYNKKLQPTKIMPNQPKKPTTPYLMFYLEKQKKCQEDNPNLKPNEIASLLGKTWREMPTELKDVYKEKYDQEYETYWTSMLEQGVISSNDKKLRKINKRNNNQNSNNQEFDEAEELKKQILEIKMQLAEAAKNQEEQEKNEEIMLIE